MSKVRDTARLHPKTVSEYQQHIVSARSGGIVRAGVASVRVDLSVWQTAMKLAAGDQTRIVVRSSTEVLVVNQSKRKQKGLL